MEGLNQSEEDDEGRAESEDIKEPQKGQMSKQPPKTHKRRDQHAQSKIESLGRYLSVARTRRQEGCIEDDKVARPPKNYTVKTRQACCTLGA